MTIRISGLWSTVNSAALHGNSKALTEPDLSIKARFLKLTILCKSVYGEKSLPENTGEVGPGALEPSELAVHGIGIGVVPNAGHAQRFENLDGLVSALTEAHRLMRPNTFAQQNERM